MRSIFSVMVAFLPAGVILACSSVEAAGPVVSVDPAPPSAEPQFKAGDVLTVAADRSPLMRGSQALANLTKGQQILVVEVRGNWIGTQMVVGGEKMAGWLRTEDFLPAPKAVASLAGSSCPQTVAQPVAYTTARPALPEAAPEPVRVPVVSYREAMDPYLVGRYIRHETDPNVHVWEPWRH